MEKEEPRCKEEIRFTMLDAHVMMSPKMWEDAKPQN
jgi:hypothetical protein